MYQGLCWNLLFALQICPAPFSTLCYELGAALWGLGQWAPFPLAPCWVRSMGSPSQKPGRKERVCGTSSSRLSFGVTQRGSSLPQVLSTLVSVTSASLHSCSSPGVLCCPWGSLYPACVFINSPFLELSCDHPTGLCHLCHAAALPCLHT